MFLYETHDPSGRLCALAGRAANGSTETAVCGPCYSTARLEPVATALRDFGLVVELTENCGYQDGPALFVTNATTGDQCAVELAPADAEQPRDMFLVMDPSGELYATAIDADTAAALAVEATC